MLAQGVEGTTISLDGFVAGPGQSRENPLGKRGRELHGWHLGDERANEADATAERRLLRPRGAHVMGRNMFGPIRGEWNEEWSGWWGPEPPYHAPVFVLTHHAHAPIEMEGGTTFHFVTDGFDAAYALARETAGADGIDIAGGARTVRQALRAGVIDELWLDIAPIGVVSFRRCGAGAQDGAKFGNPMRFALMTSHGDNWIIAISGGRCRVDASGSSDTAAGLAS